MAVYTSPFKDIYGFNKIFAGSHRKFTNANREVRTQAVYSLCMQHVGELLDSEDEPNTVSERVYSLRVDYRLNLTVHPHPLNREDVESLGVIFFLSLPPLENGGQGGFNIHPHQVSSGSYDD